MLNKIAKKFKKFIKLLFSGDVKGIIKMFINFMRRIKNIIMRNPKIINFQRKIKCTHLKKEFDHVIKNSNYTYNSQGGYNLTIILFGGAGFKV